MAFKSKIPLKCCWLARQEIVLRSPRQYRVIWTAESVHSDKYTLFVYSDCSEDPPILPQLMSRNRTRETSLAEKYPAWAAAHGSQFGTPRSRCLIFQLYPSQHKFFTSKSVGKAQISNNMVGVFQNKFKLFIR